MTSKILTCPVPSNINPLSPNGFMFSISRLPELSFFCQEVQIPSINLSNPEIATPFSRYPVSGDILDFGDLTVQFLVDSEMTNYKAIFNWIRGLGFPENYTQYTEQSSSEIPMSEVQSTTSDGTITILGNTNVPIQTVKFVDLLPQSLESLTFVSTAQDVQYLVGSATFKYSYFTFEV